MEERNGERDRGRGAEREEGGRERGKDVVRMSSSKGANTVSSLRRQQGLTVMTVENEFLLN